MTMSIAKFFDLIKIEVVNGFLSNEGESPFQFNLEINQLVEILEAMGASIVTGDPILMEVQIDNLLGNKLFNTGSHISHFIDSITFSIIRNSQEKLSSDQSQKLVSNLLPIYFHTNQYLHQQDLKLKVERIIQEQSSLEQLEKSKSDFISIAAHELKTPLTLMEGYSAMLRELLEQNKIFDEHILLLIDGMDRGSRRLREIIDDMIDVSLIDNELLGLTFQPTWMSKILAKIKEYYQGAVQTRKIMMEVNRFEGDNKLNFMDSERIFQAISNVVSNAIKYTPDGGRIEINGRQLDEYVEITIKDNGIGIDLADQIKIFDKFQAGGESGLHSSGKLKFKGGGPGLGLPISKGIIEAHGGRIWVESEGYNEINSPGSTFYIILPNREESPILDYSESHVPLYFRNLKRNLS